MLSILLLACDGAGRSVAEDMAVYTEVLRTAGQDLEAELARCLALADPDLRGECAGVVALAALRAGGDPERWCAQVPEGKWRSECHFQAAELTLLSRDPAGAAALCQSAGAYRADCVMHLWQPRLSTIVSGMGPAQFGERYPRALQLYTQTASLTGVVADFEQRFWFSFFQAGFQAAGRVDMDACAALDPEGRARCEQAAALLLTAPLEGALRSRGALQRFCGQSAPSSSEIAGWLGTEPSPALDQALREQQPLICGAGRRPALNGGLRTTPPG